MDYDENDFQNQSFELTREDTSKFSSILRPFSLPKFDIDEPLHVPVRFDSLPEPDSLFTITGLCSSSSNWINEFSPQNSTSKAKNVWSEATSSESVEMLLKSVREEEPAMDGADPRENLNGTDYSHMMDMDPSGSMLDPADDRQMGASADECLTEEKHIENSLGSTKLPESSDGLLESITNPIRNLNKDMQNKEISPLAERYGISTQFENVSYPRIGTPLIETGEESKELSDEIIKMEENESYQIETEQTVTEDCAKPKDPSSIIEKENEKGIAAVNNEEGVMGNNEPSLKERDVISATENVVVSDVVFHDSSNSQSDEQGTSKDGSEVNDAVKEQFAGPDHIKEVETPLEITAKDSMIPCENNSGKGTEVSTDHSDSVTAPEAVISGSVTTETLLQQGGADKQLSSPPPSVEGKSSPITSETNLDGGPDNTISAEKAQVPNPCAEVISDVAKDDSLTAGTCTDNNQSSTELTCGSPTVISGLDETKEDGTLEDPAQDANKGKHVSASEDDKSFSFNVVANIPERETVTDWKPFSAMKSPDTATPSKESSEGGTLPSNTKRKKSEVSSDIKTPKTDAKTSSSPSSKKKRERKKTPQSTTKSPANSETSKKLHEASGLPDLNTSAAASSAQLVQHQPFTDVQHVQLRAQIFVYGSLIQGVPPSEAYMVSAFGDPAAGRKKWEAAWRTAMEKYKNQKSPPSAAISETPGSSRPVHRSTDSSAPKESAAAKRKSSASGKPGTKSQLPATSSPMLPTSLPRGTQLDFTQNTSPSPSPIFNPYQPLQLKNSAWLSPSPQPNPWFLSTQSSVFTKNTPVSVSPIPTVATISTTAEASKIKPRRKTLSASVSVPPSLPAIFPPMSSPAAATAASSTTASITPILPPSNVIATVVSAPAASTGATDDAQNITAVSSPLPTLPPAATPKTRKRKKAPAAATSEIQIPPEKHQISSSPLAVVHTTTSSLPTQPKIIFTGQLASGTSLVPATSFATTTAASLMMPSFPVASAYAATVGAPSEHHNNKKLFSSDVSSKFEQSKLNADDAAAQAAAAVRHNENVWAKLNAQKKNSALDSDIEQKLASAAATASAAAAIAKAAAAAAKVASDAALQAKMMAEEAVMSEKPDPSRSVQTSFIAMAKETAKKRVEDASAAAKRAENLDSVIRAAEIVAEAVSQAAVVVSMGDPLPLNIKEMLDFGPEGYWKAHYYSKADKQKQLLPGSNSIIQTDVEEARVENQEKVKEKSASAQQVPGNTDAGNTSGDIPVSTEKDIAGDEPPSAKDKEIGFQKGSQIEVCSEEPGLKGTWFHATVLDVKENQIHVCYTDRFADEELGQVREWIELTNEEDGKPPRVRTVHPATGPKPEGIRKRRREAVGSSSWAIGDHVDAWIRDGWREGIVTEKSDGDRTKYTVQFLVAGGSSVVESWHLRPSLIWQNGQWSLWSRSLPKKTHPKEGDSPYEKRQRFGPHESDSTNQTTTAANANANTVSGPHKKPEDSNNSRQLNVPVDDNKTLPMGKFTMGETTNTLLKHAAAPQKERSRVIFGVPRPGKKKKYMDVSKHYDGEKKPDKVLSSSATSATEANTNNNASFKVANYQMPQNRAPKTKAKERGGGGKSGKSSSHVLNSSETSLDSLSEQRTLTRKKLGASTTEHGLGGNKGKNVSSSNTGNVDMNAAESEPRRSNRRIQPTSRLLEGLQSSLMIAKMPGDKGTRTTLKSGTTSNNSKGRVNG